MTEKIKAETEKAIDEIGQYVSEFNVRPVLLQSPRMRQILTDFAETVLNNEWINVRHEVPVKSGNYLIVGSSGKVYISYYMAKSDYWSHGYYSTRDNPLFWMPLPQPPEGE